MTSRERIRQTVREAVVAAWPYSERTALMRANTAEAVADSVADQLSVPVLGEEDLEHLKSILQLVDLAQRETDIEWRPDAERALLYRLIAGTKP